MKLMHPLFSRPICFRENHIPVLILENPVAFRRIASELIGQSEGRVGGFILSRDDCCLDCSEHLRVFYDYAHLDIVEKRIQTKELSALLRTVQESLAEETFRLSQAMQEYLARLAMLAEKPVAYEQSENLSALLKAMDFRVDLSGLSPCEALFEQLALAQRCMKNPCMALIHARTYFSSAEMQNTASIFG